MGTWGGPRGCSLISEWHHVNRVAQSQRPVGGSARGGTRILGVRQGCFGRMDKDAWKRQGCSGRDEEDVRGGMRTLGLRTAGRAKDAGKGRGCLGRMRTLGTRTVGRDKDTEEGQGYSGGMRTPGTRTVAREEDV